MVRLNAIQRQAPPTSIEPYCLDTDSIDVASKYRVVIATCVTAGGFHRLRLGVGHFTHIFVDECGQASEPECLLPVSLAAGFKDAVVNLIMMHCKFLRGKIMYLANFSRTVPEYYIFMILPHPSYDRLTCT